MRWDNSSALFVALNGSNRNAQQSGCYTLAFVQGFSNFAEIAEAHSPHANVEAVASDTLAFA
jgi:hypothetical protein